MPLEDYDHDETLLKESQNTEVKNHHFTAILTSKRFILKYQSSEENVSYKLDLIEKAISETDSENNPAINFSILVSPDNIQNLVLHFPQTTESRFGERDEWMQLLNQALLSKNLQNNYQSDIPNSSIIETNVPINEITQLCSHCGSELEENSSFCSICGKPTNGKISGAPPKENRNRDEKPGKKPNFVQETRCTCFSCGNIWHYGKKEIRDNRSKKMDNIGKEAAAATCCYCNPLINATKTKTEITDFDKCPKCGSRNIKKEEITHEIY